MPMMRLFYSMMFMFCFSLAANAEQRLSNNVVISVSRAAQVARVSKALPSGSKMILAVGRFILVSTSKVDLATLQRLKRIDGVLDVRPTFRVHYLSSEVVRSQPAPKTNGSATSTTSECIANSRCGAGERNRLWAQTFMATDLAQNFVAKKRIVRSTRIGVVDSGLDSRISDRLHSGVSVNAVGTSATDLNVDSLGHGSRVVSLIKGRDGIGGSVGSRVDLYSLGPGENIDSGLLGLAILKACRGGNDIVNVSIGMDLGFIQTSLSVLVADDIMKEITETGCILVHSAGNDSAPISANNVQQLQFEVGATNSSGKPASFSSRSEFSAPGENVIGFEPASSTIDATLQCNADKVSSQSFASGTSFAAPLVTSTMSLVRDVALQSPQFRKLDRSGQAAMLREFLNESKTDGVVNAYLAVKIADEWTRKPRESVAMAKTRFVKKSAKSCGPHFQPNCTANSCEQAVACEPQLREYALKCGSQDSSAVVKLVDSMQSRGNLEGAAYWLRGSKVLSPDEKTGMKFPVDQMNSSLVENQHRANVVRWLDYYKNWKASVGESTVAQTSLMAATGSALKNATANKADESDHGARSDLTKLFVEMKKADPTFATVDWMKRLFSNPASQKMAVSILAHAQREGVVSNTEVKQAADFLLANPENEASISNGLDILEYADIGSVDRISYATKVLSNQKLTATNLERAAGLPSPSDFPSWLEAKKTAAGHPGLNDWVASKIAMRLYLFANDFNAAERKQAFEVLDILKPRMTTQDGRDYLEIARARLNTSTK